MTVAVFASGPAALVALVIRSTPRAAPAGQDRGFADADVAREHGAAMVSLRRLAR